jgi:thymidine kinase
MENPTNSRKRGKLIVIDGPMFSFKSTELINRVHYELAAKRSAIIFKPQSDTRGDKMCIETHDKIKEKAVMIEDNICKYKELALEFDVIAIDEGQFFKGLAEFCRDLVEWHSKVVIVAGLNLTYQHTPWPEMQALYPYATEIVRRHAACAICGKPAIYTERIGGGTDLIQPGGEKAYRPLCSYHIHNSTENSLRRRLNRFGEELAKVSIDQWEREHLTEDHTPTIMECVERTLLQIMGKNDETAWSVNHQTATDFSTRRHLTNLIGVWVIDKPGDLKPATDGAYSYENVEDIHRLFE